MSEVGLSIFKDTAYVRLEFENKENAQLTAQCVEKLFENAEWADMSDETDPINRTEKRLAEAFLGEEDAVSFGGVLFSGHVLVSQARSISTEGKIVGTITQIVPMDDAFIKPMFGRSGYYGTGIHKLGSCPVM